MRYFITFLLGTCVFTSFAEEPPHRAGVSQTRPSHNSENGSETAGRQYPTEGAPFPVRVIESPGEAANAAVDKRDADKNQKENLAIQERATEAAEGQSVTARWQMILSVLGALLILWTLHETRRTAAAAVKSVELSYALERPYLRISPIESFIRKWGGRNSPGPRWSMLDYVFDNYGKTPAMITEYAHALFIGDTAPAISSAKKHPIFHQSVIREKPNEKDVVRERVFFEDYLANSPNNFDPGTCAELISESKKLYFFGYVKYDDIFGRSHEATFCWYYVVEHDAFSPVKDKTLNRTT